MSRWVWWADSESASTNLPLHEGYTAVSPLWDLAVFLEGLKSPPFEPLQGTEFKLKTVLLLTLDSPKCVSASVMRTVLHGLCEDDLEA